MKTSLLKGIIYGQRQIIREAKIIPREYSLDPNFNYVLVGLRRAGKSTLLYKVAQDLVKNGVDWDQIIYVNFEDERLLDFTVNDFNDIVRDRKIVCVRMNISLILFPWILEKGILFPYDWFERKTY